MKWDLGLFDRAKHAIKGYLNFEEIWKSLTVAMGAAGSVLTLLTTINDVVTKFITDPFIIQIIHNISGDATNKKWFSVGIGILVLGGELWRRGQHGGELIPVKDIIPVTTQMEVAPIIPVSPNVPPTPAPIVAVVTADPQKPPEEKTGKV